MTSSDKRFCAICAWRGTCQKRFSVPVDGLLNVYCPDYTRDIQIKDTRDLDRALVDYQISQWQAEARKKVGPTITFSRETGGGGSEIARIVATRLKMDLIGGQIIQKVAESAKMSTKVIETLDEKGVTFMESIVNSMFASRHIWPDEYLRHLTMVIGAAGQHGNAVLMGRGANFILKPERTFRLRIIAPLEKRVQYLMERGKLSRSDAEKFIVNKDADRKKFIKKNFKADVSDPAHYDLVVNTAYVSVEGAVAAIIDAFEARTFVFGQDEAGASPGGGAGAKKTGAAPQSAAR